MPRSFETRRGFKKNNDLIETAGVCDELLMNLIGNILDVSNLEVNMMEIDKMQISIQEIFNKLYCKQIYLV